MGQHLTVRSAVTCQHLLYHLPLRATYISVRRDCHEKSSTLSITSCLLKGLVAALEQIACTRRVISTEGTTIYIILFAILHPSSSTQPLVHSFSTALNFGFRNFFLFFSLKLMQLSSKGKIRQAHNVKFSISMSNGLHPKLKKISCTDTERS